MKRLLGKLLLYVLGVAVMSALFTWVLIPNNPDAYQAATADKIRLVATTPSPRLILVGGSNLAFSIDSGLIEDSLGLPVVNMGLSKATGLRYLLEEVKPFLSAGDLVIVAPEYELYFDLFYGSESLVILLQHYPGRITDVTSLGEFRTIVDKFALMMQMKLNGYLRNGLVDDPIYRRSGFDENGDLVTHLDETEQVDLRSLFDDERVGFQEEALKALNAFGDYAADRGAMVGISYPSLYDVYFNRYIARIEQLDRRLRSDLTIPVISRPSDYIFPRDRLFDTPYHLRREGRRQRALQLVADIRASGMASEQVVRYLEGSSTRGIVSAARMAFVDGRLEFIR